MDSRDGRKKNRRLTPVRASLAAALIMAVVLLTLSPVLDLGFESVNDPAAGEDSAWSETPIPGDGGGRPSYSTPIGSIFFHTGESGTGAAGDSAGGQEDALAPAEDPGAGQTTADDIRPSQDETPSGQDSSAEVQADEEKTLETGQIHGILTPEGKILYIGRIDGVSVMVTAEPGCFQNTVYMVIRKKSKGAVLSTSDISIAFFDIDTGEEVEPSRPMEMSISI